MKLVWTVVFSLVSSVAVAAGGPGYPLEQIQPDYDDKASLQRGWTTHTHYCLGCAHAGDGEKDRAARAFEAALRLGPAKPGEVHYRLARLFRESDPERAKRHVLDALAEAPPSASFRSMPEG